MISRGCGEAMKAPRLVIAGTASNVGKTTVTLALLAAFTAKGRVVQAFKAGPDFIDPGHHTAVTGRPSRNLDGWMLGRDVNREIFVRAAAGADLSLIEGMMGLFDGSSPISDLGSTAELAKQLEAPVLLVIDGSAMARSAAAIVEGFVRFDPALAVAAVVFNRVNSDGHYRLLKEAVEQNTKIAVVGYLPSDKNVSIPDRHLGLVTAIERGTADLYARLGQAAGETIDLDRIEKVAGSAGEWPISTIQPVRRHRSRGIRIGLAQDQAFCFYYPDNLELLQSAGAELVRFSPIADQHLPDVDMLYLGGGYPELHAHALARNSPMRQAVRAFSERGGTIYAECGGMMYLTESIRDFDGGAHEMVGLFPAEAVMRKPGLTLGYRTVEVSQPCILGAHGTVLRGHEFHYSALSPKGPLNYACALTDARGESKGWDGLIARRTLGLYTHLHFKSHPQIAETLVESALSTAPAGVRPITK
jgi:cobyrinic acid a,c-diamide synthase